MKIAVYHNLPSGGAKRALYEQVRRLACTHTIDVYSLSTADHDYCDLRMVCRRHHIFAFAPLPLARSPLGRLNQGLRALDLLRLRALQREVARQIDAGSYDVAFVHPCRYAQAPGLLAYLQTAAVYYCQEPPRMAYEQAVPRPYLRFSRAQRLGNYFDPLPGLYRSTLKRLDRANVHAAALVLVNSDYSRENLYRIYGIFATVAYLGVDADLFRPLDLPRADFLLSVGQLNPRKGFDFLLYSLAHLPAAERPPLVVVSNFGDPRERDYLEALASQLGVAASFRELVPDDDLVRLYNQARLTLYAPVMEPFGFVPLESMACGTPVVGLREGGVRETVIDGCTGRLVERDPRRFAEAIAGLLRDEECSARYASEGRQYVMRCWRWESTTVELERHFIDTINRTAV